MRKINEITGAIVDSSMMIHKDLGPGLLESVYQSILAHELEKRGFQVVKERGIPVEWDGVRMDLGLRADLIVAGKVIVELKSLEALADVHKKQLLTYLKVSGLSVGMLINFGEALLKEGICRIVNDFKE